MPFTKINALGKDMNSLSLKDAIRKDIMSYLSVELEHAQYYRFLGDFTGCGSSNAEALRDLMDQLPDETPAVVYEVLNELERECSEKSTVVGYSVYARKGLNGEIERCDVEITELFWRQIDEALAVKPEFDEDGEFNERILDADNVPEEIWGQVRSAIEDCEHYMYASLDLAALMDDFFPK